MAEKVPVVIYGKYYESMSAAARDFALHPQTIADHLERGTLDRVGTGRKTNPKPVVVNGQSFPSILAAARTLHMGRDTVKKIVKASK